jgi:trimeric autotransporter adhesin
MKNKTSLSIAIIVALMIAQSISTSRAGPPNPTPSDGFRNTAGGNGALIQNSSGLNNTGFGYGALNSNTTANNNTAIGANALISNVLGSGNTADGVNALLLNTNGAANTAIGVSALSNNTLYSGNTAFGYQALTKKSVGNFNLALGYQAGFNLTSGGNNIYLSNIGIAAESSTIRIGTSTNQTRTFMAGVRGIRTGLANAVAVVIDSNGQLGTLNSSARFKKDIHDMDTASRQLLELRPVTYHYKQISEDGSNPLEYGLIAEEVAKINPDLVAYGADGKIETVQYHKLTPMLVNEVKHLNNLLLDEKRKNEAQAQEISNLKQQMTVLQAQAEHIEALTSLLSRIEANQTVGMVAR